MHLVVDEPMHTVAFGETCDQVLLVKPGANEEIAGHAHVVGEHGDARINLFCSGFISHFKPADQRNIHSADETDF